MKKSRFSDSQILSIFKQAENGVPVPELRRDRGLAGSADPQSAELGLWSVLPASAQCKRLYLEPQTGLSDLPGAGT